MSASPSAQDVADALAMTLEREDASGAPWCPPGDAAALRQWVTDRSASLGTGLRRATRLARLMAVADGRADYIRFLYERESSGKSVKDGRFSPNNVSNGPVRIVVTRAMTTSMVKMRGERMPRS